MALRQNGARDMLTKELAVLKRLVLGGHTDEQIGCMLGRTTRGVRGLREYYGLTDPERYKRTGSTYSVEEDEKVNKLLWDWVMVTKLPGKEMAERLKVLHPPGLHYATIMTRLKSIDPSGYLWEQHSDNSRARKAALLSKRHRTGQERSLTTGQFKPREKAQ